MKFYLKERYTFKSEFYSLESLIDYLRSQKVNLVVRDKVEFSRTYSRMTYLGTAKFPGCYGYEEALYVHDILESEEETMLTQLRVLGVDYDVDSLENV